MTAFQLPFQFHWPVTFRTWRKPAPVAHTGPKIVSILDFARKSPIQLDNRGTVAQRRSGDWTVPPQHAADRL